MKIQYSLALILAGFGGSAACSQQLPGAGAAQTISAVTAEDLEVLGSSTRSVPLENTVAISEATYLLKIANGEFAAADEDTRKLQVYLSAQANEPSALGVVGHRKEEVSLDGKRILVLHNQRNLKEEAAQATSFSVLNGQLWGQAEGVVELALHFGGEDEVPCKRPFRGCSILTAPDLRPSPFANWESGGLGLPPETRLDAESATLPQNQTGHTIELWNIPNSDLGEQLWPKGGFIGNRFACAEPMEETLAAECDASSEGDALRAPTGIETALGSRVVMVTEADFQAALLVV